jgi:hypothetical protein
MWQIPLWDCSDAVPMICAARGLQCRQVVSVASAEVAGHCKGSRMSRWLVLLACSDIHSSLYVKYKGPMSYVLSNTAF